MSVWGKIVGGAAGLMIGGPIGALLGAAAGHAYDALADDLPAGDGTPITARAGGAAADAASAVDTPYGDRPAATQHIAFTIGVIALAAKMAKVDGVVTRREIDAFRSFFHVPPEEVDNVGRFFDLAKRDSSGFEAYARQVASLFPAHPEVLEEVLAGLFLIAKADDVHVDDVAKLAYLRSVSTIFGLSETQFRRVAAAAGVELNDDPYAILDIMPDVGDEAVQQAYRRLARVHHPDRLIARGLPPEAIALANRKLAAINGAYDRIRRERRAQRPEAQPVT